MKQELAIPEKVEVGVDKNRVSVKGPKGQIQREFRSKNVMISVDNGKVLLFAKDADKKDKTMMNTFKAHIHNMMVGVVEGYVYTLKICSGHFPMNVSIKGNEFSIKNFLGEKVPRTVKIVEGVSVKVDGEKVTVEGIDIEKCGQCAASIELATRITNRDKRIFQDGIWLTSKPGNA